MAQAFHFQTICLKLSTMWRVLVFLVICQAWCVWCAYKEEYAAWESLSYKWPTGFNETEYLADGRYIPENLQFSAIASHHHFHIGALPRLKPGVPFVLVTTHSKLYPWPMSSNKQRPGNCTETQNPLALDVDHDNDLLYVLDNGHTEIHTDTRDTTCPPKIMAINLTLSRNVGKTHLSQNLDPSVISQDSVLLSFVFDRPSIDSPFAKHAFIADGGTGKIIVHDLRTEKSWAFQDPRMNEMVNQNVTINEGSVRVRYGINALAMSPLFDYVYFTCTGSHNFYQIPVAALLDPDTDISSKIRLLSTKMISFANGLLSTKDAIYFSAQEKKDIRQWRFQEDMANQGLTYPEDTDKALMKQTSSLLHVGKQHWPYAMALNTNGDYYYISSKPGLLYEGEFKKFHLYENNPQIYQLFRVPTSETGYHYKMGSDDVVG